VRILNVSHIAIGVRDMDTSVAFYRDVLGMTVTLDEIEEFGDGERFPRTRRRGAYLRWDHDPHAPFVVLDQQLSTDPFGEPATLFQVGVHHVGFWVDDVDAVADRARAAGLEPMTRPANADTVAYGEAPGRTVRTMFLRDPEGNVVQFDQRLG
jgi:catechol 2,3-dioxygenase-like lactoylglutathione lyase family enzyme